FGTAVMKCTPAHDPNDFELGKKYGLDMPICMNPDGTMNALAHKYEGMDRFKCREALLADFEAAGVIDHIEEHKHNVGHSERTGVIAEPYLSKQWFVRMKPLADAVLANQGGEENIGFVPPRFEHTFRQWLENIEDWCISRQLWWGHRIPAWFHKETGEIYVGETAPEDIENWIQDEDVLDTWFSSALWPFSTLGWPEDTADFERYYPTDVLVTGYDIIFFWVARMAFQARHMTNNRPFKEVLIHGLIRDNGGRKMSKSLGNGVDPIEVIENKGADALRFFLTTNSAPGMDLRFDPKKLDSAWNFINKIWNAARYVQMQMEDGHDYTPDFTKLSEADQWILSRLNATIQNVTKNLDRYELAMVGNELYSFVWDDFCSWYIELSKAALNSDNLTVKSNTIAVLVYVLKAILILLSPFMPFVTEHIYLALNLGEESINLETWPSVVEFETTEKATSDMNLIIAAIEAIREIKTQYGLKPKEIIRLVLEDAEGNPYSLSQEGKALLEGMAKIELIDSLESEDLLVRDLNGYKLKVDLQELIDVEAEIA
ncbi:MAG: valine--tRNA ligase, partial [Allobaculum sp.]|nr:valine--tRNA ligase [Allobaculum sp.]